MNIFYIVLFICLGLTSITTLHGSIFGAVLPSIVQDLKIDWGLIGITMSVWTLISAVSPFFLSKRLYKMKPLNTIILVMLVSSFSTMLTSFARNYLTLNLARISASILGSFTWTISARIVAMYVESKRRGLASAIYGTGSMIGLALAYVVTAFTKNGWPSTMIKAGFFGIIYIVFAYIVWKLSLESRLTEQHEEIPSPNNPAVDKKITSRHVYKIVLWLSLGHFSAVYTWNFMFTWLSTFLVYELNIDYKVIAISLVFIAIVSSVLTVLMGIWSDKKGGFKGRVLPLYIGLTPAAILLVVSPYISSSMVAALIMSVAILLWRISTPSFWSIFNDLIPLKYFEKASSTYVAAVLISGIVSSTVNGYIVELTGSMKYAIILASIILIFSPVFYTIAAKIGYRENG